MFIKYFIFTILFFSFVSQNIITSWSYDKVSMYDIQKINKFLSSFIKEPIEIPLTIKNDTLIINNISLIQIQTNLYDSLINYNTGLLLFSPNKITLCFNFSYSDIRYKGNSLLELKIKNFKLKVKNDKTKEKSYFSIKMNSPKENYIIQGIPDKEFLNWIKSVLYQEFTKNLVLTKIIPEYLEYGLYNYYIDFYKKNKEFKIETNNFFGNMNFPMENNKYMYFCEDLLNEYKTAFCYYSGFTSIYEESKDKTKVPLINENFSHNEKGLYNIFINNDMIKTIIEYISLYYFSYSPKYYNNKTNIKKLSYEFNVASLQKYFTGLEQLKPENIFDCEIYIENGTLNEAIYRIKVNIQDEKKNNFVMRVSSNIKVDIPLTKNVRFNLCLNNTLTKYIEILSSSLETKIDIKDLEGLKKVIEESYDFSYNPICLSDNGFSLKDYFSEIINSYTKEEGIYFEGKHLYQ